MRPTVGTVPTVGRCPWWNSVVGWCVGNTYRAGGADGRGSCRRSAMAFDRCQYPDGIRAEWTPKPNRL